MKQAAFFLMAAMAIPAGAQTAPRPSRHLPELDLAGSRDGKSTFLARPKKQQFWNTERPMDPPAGARPVNDNVTVVCDILVQKADPRLDPGIERKADTSLDRKIERKSACAQ